MSAEPTAEQQALAYDLLDCEKADDPFPYCDAHGGSWPCSDATRVARALAAAVIAERERVIALCLQVMAENESPDDWGVPAVYPSIVARRIREVSS